MTKHTKQVLVLSANTSWNLVNFRRGLIAHLQSLNYQVVALAPADESVGMLVDMGCQVVNIDISRKGTNPIQDFFLWQNYRRVLEKLKPVAFLGWTIKPNIYGSLAAHSLGIPVINNISGLGAAFLGSSWLSLIARLLYRRALRNSHRVFFQNPDDEALFLKKKLTLPISTALLPGSGIDLSYFSFTKRMPIEGRSFRVLMIARLLFDKGVLEFIESSRILRNSGLKVQFQVLGQIDANNPSAVSQKELSAWVKEGVIEYLGAVQDVRPLIAQADVIVLPSYREGTPRTLLEAAAMGRPLIATDVPGCREVVRHEFNGYLCQVKSAESLSIAIERLLNDSPEDWTRMAISARKTVEQHFDERIVFEAYSYALRTAS